MKNEFWAIMCTFGFVCCIVVIFNGLFKEHSKRLRAAQASRAEAMHHSEIMALRFELEDAEKQVWLADDAHIGAAYYHLLSVRERLDAFVNLHRDNSIKSLN